MENEIVANVAEKVEWLRSVADKLGYDVPKILRDEAAYLRTKKAAHYHVRADALERAAAAY